MRGRKLKTHCFTFASWIELGLVHELFAVSEEEATGTYMILYGTVGGHKQSSFGLAIEAQSGSALTTNPATRSAGVVKSRLN
jgi:hypothetical protein